MLWGRPDVETGVRIAITGISTGCQPTEMLYALHTSDIGGIFPSGTALQKNEDYFTLLISDSVI